LETSSDLALIRTFLHDALPQIFSKDYLLHALNFILGCHPGMNTAAFVVGRRSEVIDPWIRIQIGPTNPTFPAASDPEPPFIRPDFPELMEWPYFWQQGEYVLGYERPTTSSRQPRTMF